MKPIGGRDSRPIRAHIIGVRVARPIGAKESTKRSTCHKGPSGQRDSKTQWSSFLILSDRLLREKHVVLDELMVDTLVLCINRVVHDELTGLTSVPSIFPCWDTRTCSTSRRCSAVRSGWSGPFLSTTRMRTVWGSDSVERWSGALECAASLDYSNFDFRSGHVVRVGLEAQVFHMGETSVVTKVTSLASETLGICKTSLRRAPKMLKRAMLAKGRRLSRICWVFVILEFP